MCVRARVCALPVCMCVRVSASACHCERAPSVRVHVGKRPKETPLKYWKPQTFLLFVRRERVEWKLVTAMASSVMRNSTV